MANNDLVKKKPVALELDTYEQLSKLAAQLRIDNPGGGFVSMSAAVAVLLGGWKELERIASEDVPVFTDEGIMVGLVQSGFIDKHFGQKL